MTIEISAPVPTSNTSVKPPARAQCAQSAGEMPAVSFLSLLGAMGLAATDAATTIAEAGAKSLNDGRPDVEPGQDDAVALAQVPLPADWGPMAASDTTAGLPGHVRAGVQGPGVAMADASARANEMQAPHRAAADFASSNPPERLNATSELQQLSAHALTAQQDGETTPVSSRDFMARVEAARMAADPDIATLRTASAPLGGASSLGQVVSMFDAAAAGLHAGGAQRSQERNQTRTAGTGSAQGLVTWGDATAVGTQHGASSVYAPGALTPAPATAMAEKVHYWVSRGVQSAELQLDAFAGGTVDVRIAVKGDEAIIEFRTDQPQARQLLLEAMPQLKELLASEGLLLSGGFVGTSAQQQGGQSQGRATAQTAVREALVGTPHAASGSSQALAGVSGGKVDLFV